MTLPAGLEALDFSFTGTRPAGAFAPVLVGVVGSGNLEVLLEAAGGSDCAVRIETSARGFGPIWEAVLGDFHARHPLAGVRISINDMGATPAVVSLRLDQAVAELPGTAQGGRP
jgi:malonate decarboxylase delta subunit